MNEEKYLKHIEAKRQNVVEICSKDNTADQLPAIITEMTAEELLEKYDIFKVIKLDQFIDMFLMGYGYGERTNPNWWRK